MASVPSWEVWTEALGLAVVGIWGVSPWMENLALCPSASQTEFKNRIKKKIYIYNTNVIQVKDFYLAHSESTGYLAPTYRPKKDVMSTFC